LEGFRAILAIHFRFLASRLASYTLSPDLFAAKWLSLTGIPPMRRSIPVALFILIAGFVTIPSAFATTYYIAASGSDSNNGTSKTTPWLHAPGMKNCSGTCASASPKPGDQVIFRGGDTWHFGNSSLSPYTGACTQYPGSVTCWLWQWGGSSGSPIYIGVDQTWYSGSSWVRPVMTGDNALSTGFVSGCTYDDSTTIFLALSGSNYLTLDNFDWQGACLAATSVTGQYIFNKANSHTIIENNYFHGMTAAVSSQDNFFAIMGNHANGLVTYNQIVGNVFDCSDCSQGVQGSAACNQGFFPNTSACVMGGGVYSEAYDIHDNVFRYMSNMVVVNNGYTAHDNLFEYNYESYSPSAIAPHPNVINQVGNIPGTNIYFYNNVMRHVYSSEALYLTVGANAYVFNNVAYDIGDNGLGGGGVPFACYSMGTVSNTGSEQLYFYNNTSDGTPNADGEGGCQVNASGANSPNEAWNGTFNFENNHFIGYSPATLSSFIHVSSGASETTVDNGHEIFQTEAVANGQGYTASNAYAPTSGSGGTVGAGVNLASLCSTFSSDSELCGGTSGGASEQSGSGGEIAGYPTIPMVARPSGGAWDAGAYELGGALPAPGTGLTAVVQ